VCSVICLSLYYLTAEFTSESILKIIEDAGKKFGFLKHPICCGTVPT